MEAHLADWIAGTPDGIEAQAVLRSCVHCGFCTATCPTYQLLGDELDGPRGRIYLIKEVLEGRPFTARTALHLDRCLTCRSCETTCPSGVRYGRLLDIGRRVVDERLARPRGERWLRWALREGLTRRALFGPAMRAGKFMRPLLPAAVRAKVPQRRDAGAWPARVHPRKVLILNGCVQPAMHPGIDAATARVLDRIGVQVLQDSRSGCCGAIRQHLGDPDGALDDMRRNIDAWWPLIAPGSDSGVEAIVVNASGCGAMVHEYAHLLRDDARYAAKAARVSELLRDPAQWLPQELARAALPVRAAPGRVVFHAPCSLQHGLGVRGVVEQLLASLGATPLPVADAHLCCGSAGTYSVFQPVLSKRLRADKLAALQAGGPELILSANVGCITHLQSGTQTPVRHWIEWLDEAMANAPAPALQGKGRVPS